MSHWSSATVAPRSGSLRRFGLDQLAVRREGWGLNSSCGVCFAEVPVYALDDTQGAIRTFTTEQCIAMVCLLNEISRTAWSHFTYRFEVGDD